MRSVHVHLVETKAEDVRAALSEFARQQPSEQWLYPPDARQPCLRIEILTDLSAYELEYPAVLERALGRRPDVSVVADVSRRAPGHREVRAFVEFLLARFRGVAYDELVDHLWTLLEIRSDAKVEGHCFFDYEGWHRNAGAA